MEETLVGFRSRADIVVIAVFGVLLCIARVSVAGPTEVRSSDERTCRTKECLDIAQTYLKNMDRSVNPCDDFYKFACGGFIKSTVIPGDKSSVSSFSLIADELTEQLRTSIEQPVEANESKALRLVKNFYKACMDEDEIDAQSLNSLGKILKKFGGWPVVSGDEWSDGDFDWKSSIYQVREAGYHVQYLIAIFIYNDMKISTKRSIYIGHPTFGLPEEYLAKGFDDKFVQEYYKYMVDIAVILGADKDRALIELKESLLFELKLVNISMSREEQRKDVRRIYNPMTLTELKKKYSDIPWTDYFAQLLPSSDGITQDEVVVVSDQNYIASVVNILKVTSTRTLANYVMWRIVSDSVPYLNRDMRARELSLTTLLKGVTKRKPRWKQCIKAVSDRLPLSVGALYVRSYFSADAKMNTVKTITDIKKQFAESLRKVEWMDDTTRKRALEKLAAMSSNAAYFDEILKVDKLEKYYENLELSGGNYLESFINCSLFESNKHFSELHKPVEKNDWTDGNPAVVNAFYSPLKNAIEIPAGILQGVFFGNDRPRYTNYGGIGFVIGHEITHGFDNIGNKFDKDGNMANWWTTTTEENFVKRTKCMIHQYGNYTVDEIGLKLNGVKTMDENIADNGGVRVAYVAYSNWASRNPREKQLPKLNYTPNQMFWISNANSWCTKYTENNLRHIVTTDNHSPAQFRIDGSLSNTAQFSKDFNCPIGSKMNPVNKCFVW